MSPLQRLRRLLRTWRDAKSEYARLSWSAVEESDVEAKADLAYRKGAVEDARRRLGSGEARELLETSKSIGLLDPGDYARLTRQLAEAAHDEVLARRQVPQTGASLESSIDAEGKPVRLFPLLQRPSTWTTPEAQSVLRRWLSETASRRADGVAEADATYAKVMARAEAKEEAAGSAPNAASLDDQAWLRATDDALQEHLARALHALRETERDVHLRVLLALRAAPFDALFPRVSRIRQLTRPLEPIGLDTRIASRIRVTEHAHLDFDLKCIQLDDPTRVHIALSPIEQGLTSALLSLRTLGEGFSRVLGTHALAFESKHASNELACALGQVLMLAMCEAAYLERGLGLDRSTSDAVHAVASFNVLVQMRLDIARLSQRLSGDVPFSDKSIARASLALTTHDRFPLTPFLDAYATTEALAARAKSAMLAPLLHARFKERFNEDYIRNPRVFEVVQGMSSRRGSLTLEEFAKELGAEAKDATDAAVLWGRDGR